MKQFQFLSALTLATSIILSCCAGNKERTETINSDSLVFQSETTTKPSDNTPSYVLVVKHNVSDFSEWKVSYEAHDSLRKAFGIHNYIIGRGLEDEDAVLVMLTADDVDKAKQFMADPKLKDQMQKDGVTDDARLILLNIQMRDTTNNTSAVRVMVTNKVRDWNLWKTVFDMYKQERADAGMMDRAIGYEVDDNSMVAMIFTVTDMAKARAFMNSQNLKDKMEAAGILGKSEVFMYTVE